MISSNSNFRGIQLRNRQTGLATLLTVIMMLLAITIMALYGARVGIFEQTSSANDARHKQAFHSAEAGVNIVIERIRANKNVLLASDTNGWFSDASKHWLPCPSSPAKTHPCFAERDAIRRASTFYFVEDPAQPNATKINLNLGDNFLPADQSVEVGMILCPLDVDYAVSPPIVNACTTSPDREALITVVSRGTSDNGRGHALIKQIFSDYDLAGGTPGASITAPFVGLPNGSSDIVANPNGGGEGVPLAIWSSQPLVINGSLDTCEAYEFYDQNSLPDNITCSTCSCARGETLSNKFTRYSDVRDNDPSFPADLFEYFFNVPKAGYESIKNSMTIVDGCSNLDASSTGGYWVNGGCNLSGAGCSIGTQFEPVLLTVSGDFSLNSCDIYGMVFITNAEDPSLSHKITMNGSSSVYGAVMVDHNMQQANGNLSIVYNKDVLSRANTFNGFAAMPGGWSDFL